ncbi:MAG: PfkB family carbohydrate kinase [Trueperaceae bacterium]|nr:PfkB family carbohydrate kinase [Trueperaceae bacterium]
MKQLDVIALGEMLIDFVPTRRDLSLQDADTFERAPGGAPANVAVGLARLGLQSGFMGKVGDDVFGKLLVTTLEQNGVDTREIKYDSEARTALAFVSPQAKGERFMFYRHPSADMRHHPDEIDDAYVRSAKAFHFGSISLIVEPARSATLKAVTVAKDAGLLISYDPNLRLALWHDETSARAGMRSAWPLADVIKISDEELLFLTGEQSDDAARSLVTDNVKLLLVTNEKGASYYTPDTSGRVPGFKVDVVETTGAGDAFMAGVLGGLVREPGAIREREGLEPLIRRANAYAALATTKRGAIPALATPDELGAFISAQS